MSFHAIHFPGTGHTASLPHRIAVALHTLGARFAKLRERHAAEAAERKLQRARARDAERLYHLAKQYEALSPNLSAELRFLASRG